MNYDEFVSCVKHNVENRLADSGNTVEIHSVIKANDQKRDGLLIREEGCLSAPTVYLDDFYEWYQGGTDLDEIVDKILEILEAGRDLLPEEILDMDDFAAAKDNITYRVLNTVINQDYLNDVPRIDYLDLSLVFYCTYLAGPEGHVMSSKISRELMEYWNVDVQTLHELARKNTPRILGIYLKEVSEIIHELMGSEDIAQNISLRDALNDHDRTPMYVLSNLTRNSGAVNIFVDGVMKSLSEKLSDDLYVIPSSIHEVLLIPVHGRLGREEVDQMIRDVNRNVLRPQEILSDHVYIYSREQDRISM